MTVILTLICRHDNCDIRHSKQHNEVYNNIPVSEGRKQEGGEGGGGGGEIKVVQIPGVTGTRKTIPVASMVNRKHTSTLQMIYQMQQQFKTTQTRK